jgi:hypothetical protein
VEVGVPGYWFDMLRGFRVDMINRRVRSPTRISDLLLSQRSVPVVPVSLSNALISSCIFS